MDWQVLTWSRLADAAAGGLIVLAAGSLAAWLCRQPVRRARLIVLSLLGAMALPALGALPVRPAVVGRPPRVAGRHRGSRRPCSPRRGRKPTSPELGRPYRGSPSGPSSRSGNGRRAGARTGPALAPGRAGGVRARSPMAFPLRADGSARELLRGGGRASRPGGSSVSSCSGA